MLTGNANVSLNTYTVTVGAGGTASTDQNAGTIQTAQVGQSSIFSTITAAGGGGGGNFNTAGGAGGNGGGAGRTNSGSKSGGTASSGYNGGANSGTGSASGGGGGAGAVGAAAADPSGGAGGTGIVNPISGSTVGQYNSGTSSYYLAGGGSGENNTGNAIAGGLGGGGSNYPAAGPDFTVMNGSANTGGGGGGGGSGGNPQWAAPGGSGVVVLRYLTADLTTLSSSAVTSGGTKTTSGNYTIHTFTSSGTFTVEIPSAPSNSVAPVISGNIGVGNVFTSNTGSWIGDAPITYTYQWNKNGANIANATASSYTTVSSDANTTLTCRVTATNSVGNSSATSNSIFLLSNGYASVDTAQGFAPSITIATLVDANVLPTLAESVSPNIAVYSPPVSSSDYSPFLANVAISVSDGNTTLTESVTTNVAVVMRPEYIGDNLANVVNVPSVTYAYTDSIPVVVSNTAAVSNTQTWYVG